MAKERTVVLEPENVKVDATPGAIQLMKENKINPGEITGTGKGGQIQTKDVQTFIKARKNGGAEGAQADVAAANSEKANQKAAENARKEAEKKKREEARVQREKEAAERKAAREKEAAEKEAGKRKKDAEAFKQFRPLDSTATNVKLDVIAPWDTAGAESRTEQSVKHLGAASAVVLIELAKTDELYAEGYRYKVVDGSRRLADYVENNISVAPAVVYPADTDDKTFHMARFMMNMARSQNMVHEAESMNAVKESTGWTNTDLAEYTGIALPTISKTLKILELPPVWMQRVREGAIKGTVAFELANLTEEQLAKLETIFKETGTVKVKDIRGVRAVDNGEAVSGVEGEAMTDGAGKYVPNMEQPEAVMEAAIRALVAAGFDSAALNQVLERTLEALEEEKADAAETAKATATAAEEAPAAPAKGKKGAKK